MRTRADLTDFEFFALRVLSERTGLVRPQFFGSFLWPGRHNGSAPLARAAGKVLNRLKSFGLAEYICEDNRELSVRKDRGLQWSDWGWRITTYGRKRLRRREKGS